MLECHISLRKRYWAWWLVVLTLNVSLRHSFVWSITCVPLDTWVCLGLSIFRVWWALEMCITGRRIKRSQKICQYVSPLPKRGQRKCRWPLAHWWVTQESLKGCFSFSVNEKSMIFFCWESVGRREKEEDSILDHFQPALECFTCMTVLTPECHRPPTVPPANAVLLVLLPDVLLARGWLGLKCWWGPSFQGLIILG